MQFVLAFIDRNVAGQTHRGFAAKAIAKALEDGLVLLTALGTLIRTEGADLLQVI